MKFFAKTSDMSPNPGLVRGEELIALDMPAVGCVLVKYNALEPASLTPKLRNKYDMVTTASIESHIHKLKSMVSNPI